MIIKVSHNIPGPTTEAPGAAGKPRRLLDQVRARMRRLGLARRTEEAYVSERFAPHQPKLAMHTEIRADENIPSPIIMIPLMEMTARKSTGASMGTSVGGSSKYISLTTRK